MTSGAIWIALLGWSLCATCLAAWLYRVRRQQDNAFAQLQAVIEAAGTQARSSSHSLDELQRLPQPMSSLGEVVQNLLEQQANREAALSGSSAATRNILNATQNAVFGVAADGTCLFANRRCHELVGAPLGALIGSSVHDTIHQFLGAAGPTCKFCEFDGAAEFQNLYNETLVTPTGLPIDIDYQSFQMTSEAGQQTRVVTLIDITERRSVERRYEALVATLPVGVFSTDLEGRVLYSNQRFLDMVGREETAVANQPLARYIHDDDQAAIKQHLAAGLDAIPVANQELRIERSDHSVLWVMGSLELERDRAGHAMGLNGIFADISELKQAQAELESLNVNLEARVSARTQALQEANVELSRSMTQLQQTQDALVEREKLAALGGLVAGMAHEINTPIGVSKGAASHLAAVVDRFTQQLSTPQDSQTLDKYKSTLTESVDLIVANLSRAADLIGRFKRVSVDQSYREVRNFDLRANIDDAVSNFSRELAAADITVSVNVEPDLRVVDDPGSFTQMHTIIASNVLAHAFGDDFEGTKTLRIDAKADADHVELIYRDNGVGIDAELRKHIFEPFFTTKRHAGGSGLGMHILFLLVTNNLGGSLECTSAPNKGMTLHVTIPRRASAPDTISR